MIEVNLSWVLEGKGGSIKLPSCDTINEKLISVLNGSGSVGLNATDRERNLDVISDKGMYLLTLGEETEDDYAVRSYTNNEVSHELIDLLGNLWDSRMITTNRDLIFSVFHDFVNTGDVSRKILS